MNINRIFMMPLGMLLMLNLLGCAAMHTSINKQDLVVQTRMTHSIFLEPVAQEQKAVFIQVKNTSGKNMFHFQNKLALALVDQGYTMVNDPKKAHYILQTNVLRMTKANRREIDSAFDAGFSGALLGGAFAAAAGGDDAAILGLGLAGSMMGVAIDAMVKDIYFTIITDLRISERSANQSDWQTYQTRIVSTANKVNLTLEEANPILVSELVTAIAGIL